jgi:hypothetical protein
MLFVKFTLLILRKLPLFFLSQPEEKIRCVGKNRSRKGF